MGFRILSRTGRGRQVGSCANVMPSEIWIVQSGNFDGPSFSRGMNELVAADKNADMNWFFLFWGRKKDHVAGQKIFKWNRSALPVQVCRLSGNKDPGPVIGISDKAAAVKPGIRRCPAPSVGRSHTAYSCPDNGLPQSGKPALGHLRICLKVEV